MQRLYKPFFIVYGILHVVGGLILLVTPDFFDLIVDPLPGAGPAVLIAVLSIFTGLALIGSAFVESLRARRVILKLIMVGSLCNALAHITNSIRGDAPIYTGPVAAVFLGLVIILLISIDRSLRDIPGPEPV